MFSQPQKNLLPTNSEKKICSLIDFVIERADVSFSEKKRLEDEYNVVIEPEQLEIINAIRDNSIDNLAISCARGVGKSWSAALSIVDLARSHDEFYIGVCAPKEGQAQRLLRECVKILRRAKPEVAASVDWRLTTNLHIEFKNGSHINGFSASEQTSSEGDHYHIIINDESHLTSGFSLSQKILPMLGSFSIARMIKIGVALYKNHFYEAMRSNSYHKIILDWTKSTRLKLSGVVTINGVDYPKFAFNRMPLSLKMKTWPNLPIELQTDGDMTEEDFKTQYMVKWVDSITQALSEDDQKRLVGIHRRLDRGANGEQYFFGLDTAGGSLKSNQKYLDFTSLSIWRRTTDGVKEKVFNKRWQGDVIGQISEIRQLLDPKVGLFPCVFGLIDYSNIGITIVEGFKLEGLPLEGIQYSHIAPGTGKNYKNAMLDYFLYELRSERVKYPRQEDIDTDKEMRDGFLEWCTLERRKGVGVNDVIEAPEGKREDVDEDDIYHDDIVNSDLLAVYASDKAQAIAAKAKDLSAYCFPLPIIGGVRSASNPGMVSTGIPGLRQRDLDPGDQIISLLNRTEANQRTNVSWWLRKRTKREGM